MRDKCQFTQASMRAYLGWLLCVYLEVATTPDVQANTQLGLMEL
jgi:hypothetical protein